MLIPILVFLMVAGTLYVLGRQLMRPGRSAEPGVLVGDRCRPLVFGPLTTGMAGVLPCSSTAKETLTRYLGRAGFYHRHALEEFLSIRNSLLAGWVLLVGTAMVVLADGNQPNRLPLVAGFVGALLLYALPALFLRSMAGGRLQRIQYALPDALDMITMTMAAGLPIKDAVRRVAQDLKDTCPDLACELNIVSRQGDLRSFEKALRQFASRTDLPEVQSLAAMVGQAERQGGGVSDALEEFADGIRRGRRQRAEEQGNKTTVKLLLPLVLCLAPPVYILLLSPAVIEMRAFVLHENRPGGALSPESAVEDTSPDSASRAGLARADRPLSPMSAMVRQPAPRSTGSAAARPRPGSRGPTDLRQLPAAGRSTAAASGDR